MFSKDGHSHGKPGMDCFAIEDDQMISPKKSETMRELLRYMGRPFPNRLHFSIDEVDSMQYCDTEQYE